MIYLSAVGSESSSAFNRPSTVRRMVEVLTAGPTVDLALSTHLVRVESASPERGTEIFNRQATVRPVAAAG